MELLLFDSKEVQTTPQKFTVMKKGVSCLGMSLPNISFYCLYKYPFSKFNHSFIQQLFARHIFGFWGTEVNQMSEITVLMVWCL